MNCKREEKQDKTSSTTPRSHLLSCEVANGYNLRTSEYLAVEEAGTNHPRLLENEGIHHRETTETRTEAMTQKE